MEGGGMLKDAVIEKRELTLTNSYLSFFLYQFPSSNWFFTNS